LPKAEALVRTPTDSKGQTAAHGTQRTAHGRSICASSSASAHTAYKQSALLEAGAHFIKRTSNHRRIDARAVEHHEVPERGRGNVPG